MEGNQIEPSCGLLSNLLRRQRDRECLLNADYRIRPPQSHLSPRDFRHRPRFRSARRHPVLTTLGETRVPYVRGFRVGRRDRWTPIFRRIKQDGSPKPQRGQLIGPCGSIAIAASPSPARKTQAARQRFDSGSGCPGRFYSPSHDSTEVTELFERRLAVFPPYEKGCCQSAPG